MSALYTSSGRSAWIIFSQSSTPLYYPLRPHHRMTENKDHNAIFHPTWNVFHYTCSSLYSDMFRWSNIIAMDSENGPFLQFFRWCIRHIVGPSDQYVASHQMSLALAWSHHSQQYQIILTWAWPPLCVVRPYNFGWNIKLSMSNMWITFLK